MAEGLHSHIALAAVAEGPGWLAAYRRTMGFAHPLVFSEVCRLPTKDLMD